MAAPKKKARRHRTSHKRTDSAGSRARGADVVAREAEAKRREADRLEQRAALERIGLDDFDEVDRKILGIVLSRPATIDRDIAAVVGLSREQVNRRRNREKFRRALEEAQMDALAIIQRNQAPAARELGNLVANPDAGIRLRAALAHVGPMIRKQGEVAGNEGAFAALLDEAAKFREKRKTEPAATEGTA